MAAGFLERVAASDDGNASKAGCLAGLAYLEAARKGGGETLKDSGLAMLHRVVRKYDGSDWALRSKESIRRAESVPSQR